MGPGISPVKVVGLGDKESEYEVDAATLPLHVRRVRGLQQVFSLRQPARADSAVLGGRRRFLAGTALRQVRRSHQVAIALAGRAAALVDRPDHETLAAAAVAGGEHALDVGRVLLVLGLDVRAGVGV